MSDDENSVGSATSDSQAPERPLKLELPLKVELPITSDEKARLLNQTSANLLGDATAKAKLMESSVTHLPPLSRAPLKPIAKLPPIKSEGVSTGASTELALQLSNSPLQAKPTNVLAPIASNKVIPVADDSNSDVEDGATKKSVGTELSTHHTPTAAPIEEEAERTSLLSSRESSSHGSDDTERKEASNSDKFPAAPTTTATGNHKPIDSTSAKKKTREKKTKVRKMLTSSQLADLFTRLDNDGDGELDLNEFAGIIKKLRITGSENFVSKVFKDVDQASGSTGSLDMQAFITAYHRLNAEIEEATQRGDGGGSRKSCFVRATRYGMDKNQKVILHCYFIPSDGPAHKYFVRPPVGDVDKITKVEFESLGTWNPVDSGKEQTPSSSSGASGLQWQGKLDALSKMMFEDSENNERHPEQKILWWIDVSFDDVDRAAAESLVSSFGLPNNSKFLASYGNFGNALGVDPKSRMFAGIGNDSTGHEVHSLSYFAQTMWIRNVPVVHHLPTFLSRLQCSSLCSKKSSTISRLVKAVSDYYTTRFAFLANFAWLNKHARDEKRSAYQRAEGLATVRKCCQHLHTLV